MWAEAAGKVAAAQSLAQQAVSEGAELKGRIAQLQQQQLTTAGNSDGNNGSNNGNGSKPSGRSKWRMMEDGEAGGAGAELAQQLEVLLGENASLQQLSAKQQQLLAQTKKFIKVGLVWVEVGSKAVAARLWRRSQGRQVREGVEGGVDEHPTTTQ